MAAHACHPRTREADTHTVSLELAGQAVGQNWLQVEKPCSKKENTFVLHAQSHLHVHVHTHKLCKIDAINCPHLIDRPQLGGSLKLQSWDIDPEPQLYGSLCCLSLLTGAPDWCG